MKIRNYLLIFIISLLTVGFTENLNIADRSVIQIIFIMFAGGFLTAFTPCVYPLIPVTIGIISEINKNYQRPAFVMSVIYSSGIILTYTVLGMLAGIGSFTFGNYMGNPVFVMLIAMLFFIMGLSMNGFYEIKLPDFITKKILNIRGSGIFSLFAMGLVAGFVAAPCTGPILASALIFISTGGSPMLGGIYLFSYAAGLSVIFIIAGSFSSLLKKLPKSGRWMVIVRSIFAIAIISYSFHLINSIYNFVSHINYITGIILIVIGILGGGLTKEADFMTFRIKLQKLLMVSLISVGIISFLSTSHTPEDNIVWIKDYDEGIKLAQTEKRPAIIDFYANWCAACTEIKKKTFPDKDIQEESKRFVMIMIDATSPDERVSEIEKRYKISGLPAIIFLDSQQNEIEELRINGFVDSREFLRRMKAVK